MLGLGALLLDNLRRPRTVSALWDAVKDIPQVGTFERFVLAVDLLYMMEAITIDNGVLRRVRP